MRTVLILLLTFSISGFSQKSFFNDTLVYKSGMVKTVQIDSFNYYNVFYRSFNTKLQDTTKRTESTRKFKYFLVYDEQNILVHDSRIRTENDQEDFRIDSTKVAEHDLSINPFLVPVLSPSLRYTYKFGNYMQWGLNARLSFLSPLVGEVIGSNTALLMFGAGIRFMPFYSEKLCFGFDFTPQYLLDFEGESALLLPVGFDFDIYFAERFGLAIDLGAGYAFGNGYTGFAPRGHVGFLMRLGKRYNVPNQKNNAR